MRRTTGTSERLIASAAALFHRASYGAVSVDDVCRRAKVKKGSFYHFFSSKQALTLAVLDTQWRVFQQEVFEPAMRSGAPALKRIERLFTRVGASQRHAQRHGSVPGSPFGNLALELGTQDPRIRAKLESIFHEFARDLATIIAAGQGRGEVHQGDPLQLAHVLIAYLEGLLLLSKTMRDPDLVHHLAPELLTSFAPSPDQKQRRPVNSAAPVNRIKRATSVGVS